jgi:hypothetical protein
MTTAQLMMSLYASYWPRAASAVHLSRPDLWFSLSPTQGLATGVVLAG